MSFRSRYGTSAEILLVLNEEGILLSFRCLISQQHSYVLQGVLLSLTGFIEVFFPTEVLTVEAEMVAGVQEIRNRV